MHAATSERIEDHRQRCRERLTLTRPHLRNPASMETCSANNLHVEGPHIDRACARLARQSVRLGFDLRQHIAHVILAGRLVETLSNEQTQRVVALPQLRIRQRSRLVGQRRRRIGDHLQLFETFTFANAKQSIKQLCHASNPTSPYLNAACECSPHYRFECAW